MASLEVGWEQGGSFSCCLEKPLFQGRGVGDGGWWGGGRGAFSTSGSSLLPQHKETKTKPKLFVVSAPFQGPGQAPGHQQAALADSGKPGAAETVQPGPVSFLSSATLFALGMWGEVEGSSRESENMATTKLQGALV